MHELGVTQEILAIVEARAKGRRVTRVSIEIGKLCAILPDAVRFCFEICREGTVAEAATLEIREVPGRARCRGCAEELLLEVPFGRCRCGGSDLEWLSGEELKIKEMEVA